MKQGNCWSPSNYHHLFSKKHPPPAPSGSPPDSESAGWGQGARRPSGLSRSAWPVTLLQAPPDQPPVPGTDRELGKTGGWPTRVSKAFLSPFTVFFETIIPNFLPSSGSWRGPSAISLPGSRSVRLYETPHSENCLDHASSLRLAFLLLAAVPSRRRSTLLRSEL